MNITLIVEESPTLRLNLLLFFLMFTDHYHKKRETKPGCWSPKKREGPSQGQNPLCES